MKESKIIQKFFKKKSLPIDDCYQYKDGLIFTTDTICEGTHFLHTWSSPEDIAVKLVEVNVSDILSSGGLPIFCFLNLGISKYSTQENWLKSFSKAFKKTLNQYQIELVGGDTYYSKITNLSLTLAGNTNRYISRSGGQNGDHLYITGNLGYSVLGYNILRKKINLTDKKLEKKAIQKHLSPKSRYALAKELFLNQPIHSMMDITDGLVQDSLKLSKASGLSLEIDIQQIPGLDLVNQNYISLDELLTSGEELELLFLSDQNIVSKDIKQIGTAIQEKRTEVRYWNQGKHWFPEKLGFNHFEN